jgi:hypothetical protein
MGYKHGHLVAGSSSQAGYEGGNFPLSFAGRDFAGFQE